MKLRPFLPAVVVVSALAVMSAAYHLASPAEPPPRRQSAADPLLLEPTDPVTAARSVRSAARDLVAREVIAGRKTVPEAAAVLGWLDARPPRQRVAEPGDLAASAGLPDCGGYTEAERLGVRVVVQVELEASRDPSLPPGCGTRARAEFLAARARGEFARLPAICEGRCARLLERARAEAQRVMAGRVDARCVQSVE